MTKVIGFLVVLLTQSSLWAAEATTVQLKDSSGKAIGNAKLTQLKKGVKIELEAKGLEPGEHAIHFHEQGLCQGPDFKSAGEHYSPKGHKHGFDVAAGPHAGDMPNLIVDDSGKVKAEIINTNVTLKTADNALMKEGGTALIIHSKSDDYKTQPSGAAGGRLACAEIPGTKASLRVKASS
jgi:superoxide dismutase, Cu-Zn family